MVNNNMEGEGICTTNEGYRVVGSFKNGVLENISME